MTLLRMSTHRPSSVAGFVLCHMLWHSLGKCITLWGCPRLASAGDAPAAMSEHTQDHP